MFWLFEVFWDKFKIADYVAVPVNKVGVMGAGLALAIKGHMTPEDSLFYQQACLTASPGDSVVNGKFIYCFTKDHWGYPSKKSWIESCLQQLMLIADAEKTLLLPRLGCGCGNLRFEEMEPVFTHYVSIMGWKEVYLV